MHWPSRYSWNATSIYYIILPWVITVSSCLSYFTYLPMFSWETSCLRSFGDLMTGEVVRIEPSDKRWPPSIANKFLYAAVSGMGSISSDALHCTGYIWYESTCKIKASHVLGCSAMLFFRDWIICYSVLKGLFMSKLTNLVMLPEIAHLLILHGMVRVWLFLSADFHSENNPMALACSLYLCNYTIVLY